MIYDLQKASLWKRISAFLFDIIIFAILAVGIAALMSFALDYDRHMDFIEERKNVHIAMCEDKYQEMHGERCEFDVSIAYEEMSEGQKEIYDMVDEALSKDSDLAYTYVLLLNFTLVMTVVAVLTSYAILEFAIPMIFKNGQTLGKKIFGIGVIRTNTVKASPLVLFIRMLFGKCTIETLMPVFILIMMFFGIIGIVGPIVLLGLVVLELISVCVTRTNSTIHDLISDTVVVDLTTQMVFESEQALIDYKKKIHEQEVASSPY
ncbi:MAG: RDD family protein [Ruminococcaceae bacterium]|nr:RDD family protein [Oscillospiraceae bacterium]